MGRTPEPLVAAVTSFLCEGEAVPSGSLAGAMPQQRKALSTELHLPVSQPWSTEGRWRGWRGSGAFSSEPRLTP